jgi:hypothetical protein
MVMALGVAQIFSWGSSYYLLGALAGAMAEETGWSLAWILSGLSLGLLIAGVVSPQMGRAVARQGGRNVLVASTVLLAAGLLVISSSNHALKVYLLGWLVIGLGMGLGLYDAAFATLGSHFGAESRAPITALTLIAGFSSTLTWPLSLFLLDTVGWRGACLAYATIEIAICLPLYILFAPNVARSARPDTAAAAGATASLSRHRNFYILGAILTVISAITGILSVNLIPMIVALGVANAAAVGFAALLGPAQVFARLAEMVLGRRYHPAVTLAVATGSLALGILLLLAGQAAIVAAVLLYGGGVGVAWVARGTVPMAIFGPETYAAQLGRLARPALIAQSVAPTLGASLMQGLGIVPTILILAAPASIAFVLALALARRLVAGPDPTA